MDAAETFFKPKFTLTCTGKLIDISSPIAMGVINVTPDSFYSSSRFMMRYRIARRANQIIEQGGSIIDIGACSTRPGSHIVSEAEELKRLAKALAVVRKTLPKAIVSVDTFRASVARRVVKDFEVDMINDISAGDMDPDMFNAIAEMNIPYIIMHMKGTPTNMQQNPQYNNVVKEVCSYFVERIDKLSLLGVADVLIDPGFGFGKNSEHNYTLLKNLEALKVFNLPLVVGVSRKSMIYQNLNTSPSKALNGTTILNTLALTGGAKILRVHDVREAVEAIKLTQITKGQPTVH
jgi:dihydropteroate synthase